MTERKPKFNSAQDDFFSRILPEEFTPPVNPPQLAEKPDTTLEDMHRLMNHPRLHDMVYWDSLRQEWARIRTRVKRLQELGVIPTEAEKNRQFRKIEWPKLNMIWGKIGILDILDQPGDLSAEQAQQIRTTIKRAEEQGGVKLDAEGEARIQELQTGLDYFNYLKRKQKTRKRV